MQRQVALLTILGTVCAMIGFALKEYHVAHVRKKGPTTEADYKDVARWHGSVGNFLFVVGLVWTALGALAILLGDFVPNVSE